MMKKLALALMFVLHSSSSSGDGGALASTRTLSPAHRLSSDGISRRDARTTRDAQRRRSAPGQRGKRVPVVRGKPGGTKEVASALVPVTEIDADGLKNLLPRADAQAARPLIINFWATWCVPCRKEFPDLVKIDADYRGRGLEFVLVSADDVSDIKTVVPKFLREMRATAMPAYLLNAADTEAAIAQIDPAWGGELPATFLFDRQGKLAYKHFGIINDAELRAEIEKVIGDK